jgi:hypothetical protein
MVLFGLKFAVLMLYLKIGLPLITKVLAKPNYNKMFQAITHNDVRKQINNRSDLLNNVPKDFQSPLFDQCLRRPSLYEQVLFHKIKSEIIQPEKEDKSG